MENKKLKHRVGIDSAGSINTSHGTKAPVNMHKARGFESGSKAVEYKNQLHREQATRRKKP